MSGGLNERLHSCPDCDHRGPRRALGAGAAADPLPVNGLALLMARRAVEGWYSGTSIDSEDTLNFSKQQAVRSMNEPYPLEKAPEAYERMMSGKARFRVVITMNRG